MSRPLSWQSKLSQNILGMVSMCFLVLMTLMAILAYVLAPDHTKNANQMHLAIGSKPPGFQTLMVHVPVNNPIPNDWTALWIGKHPQERTTPISAYFITKDTLKVTTFQGDDIPGLEMAWPLKALTKQGDKFDQTRVIQSHTFWMGTDKYGRDLLSRMLIGLRVSLSIGFIAVFISLLIGVSLGAVAGYFGGRLDATIMWLINVTWSIPTLLLVIAITLALGKGFWQVFIAVGLTMWVEVARVVRGQVMGVKQLQFITAAKALGYGHWRIITRHVLPNSLAPVIIISAANFASAILIESGLSFLGIGAQPPTPSWGSIIKDHYAYIILGKPYLALIPGCAIMALVMAFMLLGNALREVLEVK
ncbi:MAG: ABC transporter permease [Flavobacteriaceae bacterium]|nr:ABC transporter permease [Flavobacteriaceae bacterium]MDG1961686.1 ABC transporter permease [Flavobacteriaceae bacterium]